MVILMVLLAFWLRRHFSSGSDHTASALTTPVKRSTDRPKVGGQLSPAKRFAAKVKVDSFRVGARKAEAYMKLQPEEYHQVGPGVVSFRGYTCQELASGEWECVRYRFK